MGKLKIGDKVTIPNYTEKLKGKIFIVEDVQSNKSHASGIRVKIIGRSGWLDSGRIKKIEDTSDNN